MSAKKIQRVHEWKLDYKTARQRILRLSGRKLKKLGTLRKKRKHVASFLWKELLIKNVKCYITYEQIWEELESDCSDSEDDSWGRIDHKKTSPEPPETPSVKDSMDDAEPRTKTDTAGQSEGSSSTKFYENFLQTGSQSTEVFGEEMDSLGDFLASGL